MEGLGLVNLMEETVIQKLNQVWGETNYCKCNKCRQDIVCYSLNHLPTRYVTSEKGTILHRFDTQTKQSDIEITACVCRAVELVGNKPNHDMPNANSEQA
ncbi:MAG: late competence development ComFB family protein [Lachnospiraceae bacterium]|nr:late competence development ComFB family protein [Lachnospiraceae bacterium]